MRLIAIWLRLEVRRRRASLAVLTLLIAVAGGTVLVAVAGARRDASAIERMADRTKPATAAVYSNSPGFDWAAVRRFPEVTALSTFLIDYNMAYEGLSDSVIDGAFPPTDNGILRKIETPVVYEGRMFDPSRADEAVVTRGFVKSWHKTVGDFVVLDLPTAAELAAGEGSGPNGAYTGPRPRLRIVGVVGSLWFADQPRGQGFVIMSPGVVARYTANMLGPPGNRRNLYNFVSALVRLRGGERQLPQFQAHLKERFRRTDLEVENITAEWRDVQREITFEARCLLAFGAAALIAAVVLVGQNISRYVGMGVDDLRGLAAVGVTPREAVATASAPVLVAALVGGLLSVIGAYIASGWFPIGTANLVEPDPGRSADWLVFGVGFAAIAVLACGAAGGLAWRARVSVGKLTSRPSTVATLAGRLGLPVPLVVGSRFALEKGHGRAAVPVRPALVGAVAGVLGIFAAFTFAEGVRDAVHHPERFGQTFELVAYLGANGTDFVPANQIEHAVLANPDIVAMNDSRQSVATVPGSTGTFVLYSYSAGRKPAHAVLVKGAMPEAPDELVVAPRTADQLNLAIGDHVVLRGDRTRRMFEVSGVGFVPSGPRNSYAEGGWLTRAGYDAIFSGFKFHLVHASVRPGASVAAVSKALRRDIAAAAPQAAGYTLTPPDPPIEKDMIRSVQGLPVALGVFLGVLALGAVGHAVVTAVRRRASELAILRAVGMTRRQSASVVATQASVLAAIGLVAGIPLGLAIGRTVWRFAADSTPLMYKAPWDGTVLVVLVPTVIAVANLVAALPARMAARLRIANVLRAQ